MNAPTHAQARHCMQAMTSMRRAQTCTDNTYTYAYNIHTSPVVTVVVVVAVAAAVGAAVVVVLSGGRGGGGGRRRRR